MLEKREYPIIEFDSNREAKISPFNVVKKLNVPECCVITFFGEVIQELLDNNKLRQIALRVSEGCVTVEMEAAAFFAVSQFRGVKLGQIIYGGDDLSEEEWDDRSWIDRKDIRSALTELSMKICLQI